MTSSDRDDPATPAPTFRLVLLGVLLVVLLASIGTSIWLVATRGADVVGLDGGATEVQSERDAVMSQSRQFMLRMGTYGPEQLEGNQLPEYRDLVSEVITPKLEASFERQVSAAEQIVGQAGVGRTAEVFATGVTTLDDDSATALVAGTFTDAYPDRKGELDPQEPVPFRFQVTLVKTGGEWLVDDFTPVTGGER
ncbi:hypothetical protein [Nocardioides sp. GXQ0305]|uniref:hypothetical protein n=1 Tax=Nocardioides sp. GXQ0305 TaxID=3423912 RepID=UPI003D7E28E0